MGTSDQQLTSFGAPVVVQSAEHFLVQGNNLTGIVVQCLASSFNLMT
ncbi:hypothetical protein [Paenibacillus pabuli]|nr:hypothetical protein [Paenibacillus pabuli]